MNLTSDDLQLLDAYLDDELRADEVEQLLQRLAAEPVLSAALEEARSQRQLRGQVFAAMQPTAAESQQAVRQAMAGARRAAFWSRSSMVLRYTAAAAACVLIGIGLGTNRQPSSSGPAWSGATPAVNGVQNVSTAGPAGGPVYNVNLSDDAGRLLATQRFGSLEQARQFADDVQRWQTRQKQIQDAQVKFVADRF